MLIVNYRFAFWFLKLHFNNINLSALSLSSSANLPSQVETFIEDSTATSSELHKLLFHVGGKR